MEAKAAGDGNRNQNTAMLVSGLISIMSFPAGKGEGKRKGD